MEGSCQKVIPKAISKLFNYPTFARGEGDSLLGTRVGQTVQEIQEVNILIALLLISELFIKMLSSKNFGFWGIFRSKQIALVDCGVI